MSSTITCPFCGQSHRSSARFCPSTGKQIPKAPPKPPEIKHPPAATGLLPLNSVLHDRYLIVDKIMQGGMSAIYRSTDTQQPGVVWAIKEMSDAAFTDPQDRAYAMHSFKQEASLLQKLSHPNLPKVMDYFTHEGKHYFVMEYVPGKNLQEMLDERQAPFPEREVMAWVQQLCNVLSYLHDHRPQIIFRDLKPSNIMLTPDGRIKLIDFGIVRFFKPGKSKDTLALGTPGYSAPEASHGQTDERSDIYSLCVTIHQLLTGHNPATTIFNIPPACSLNPQLSPKLEKIIERGLHLQRHKRWANIRNLQQAFHSLTPTPIVQPQGKVSVAPARAAVSRPTTRLVEFAVELSNTQIALILGGLLVLIITATWFLTPQLKTIGGIDRIAIYGLFGAFGYAAVPKRYSVLVSHITLTTAVVGTIWLSQGFMIPMDQLLIPIVLSGLAMEIWVALLNRVKGSGHDPWRRELAWLTIMAVIGSTIFISSAPLYGWEFALDPVRLGSSALFGALGWFLGDSIQQFILYRQIGVRPSS